MMESGKDVKNFEFDRYDTYDWYLSLGPLCDGEPPLPARVDSDVERLRRAIPTTTSSGSGRRSSRTSAR